jgi:hypothetical protein
MFEIVTNQTGSLPAGRRGRSIAALISTHSCLGSLREVERIRLLSALDLMTRTFPMLSTADLYGVRDVFALSGLVAPLIQGHVTTWQST